MIEDWKTFSGRVKEQVEAALKDRKFYYQRRFKAHEAEITEKDELITNLICTARESDDTIAAAEDHSKYLAQKLKRTMEQPKPSPPPKTSIPHNG